MAAKTSDNNVSIKDIIEHYGVDEKQLDAEILSEYFHEISLFLSDWRLLAPVLGINTPTVKVIEKDIDGEELKRQEFLIRFKCKLAMKATYRKLMNALLAIDRAEEAGNICEFIKNKGELLTNQ